MKIPFSVPQFVLNGSRDVKRYYLAGLLGSEMTTPKLGSPHSFKTIQFEMSKTGSLEREHTYFLEQIRELLNEFGVRTSNIKKNEKPRPENSSHRFVIHSKIENIARLYENIPLGFFYAKRRTMEDVMDASRYHEKRAGLYSKAKALRAQGKTIKEISEKLNIPYFTTLDWIRGKRKPILAGRAGEI